MKDSSQMLNFNCNRNLNFDTTRGVSFDTDRALYFDSERDLMFDVNRDLGIRMRGVIFRGYVCPVCGASVAKDAAECDECFVRFKPIDDPPEPPKEHWDRGRKVKSSGRRKSKPKTSKKKKKSSKTKSTFECPVCGKLLYTGTAECPGCGLEFILKDKGRKKVTVKPPAQPTCTSCGYRIPKGDRFCRRCGSPISKSQGSATVSWDDYKKKDRSDGIVSWDERSNYDNDVEGYA